MAADEIIIETTSQEVIEVGAPGPQGPAGAAGTGLETLTTQGDTLYRGASTGERLPIGSAGQVLKVVNGLPAWANESGAVTSVNGQTGAVTVAALNHAHTAADINSESAVAGYVLTADGSGDAAWQAAGGGNPFDQNLDTTDSPQFASIAINEAAPSRIYHQSGGKLLVHSDNSSYGQMQLANPQDGECTFVLASQANPDSNGQSFVNSTNPADGYASSAHVWAFGIGPYGLGSQNFVINNNSLGAGSPAVLVKDDGKVGLGVASPATRLDVKGKIRLADTADETKQVELSAASVATGQVRIVTFPDKNITLDDAGDARTPTAHNHNASDINAGTLTHERGGLEADVSAYSGLLKISGGSTSAVTVSATGESVIGAADAAAARSAISAAAASHTHGTGDITGLGGAATLSVGTTSGTVAAGDDSRFHTRSHAMTGTSDHTASNWSVFYSNGSGQVTELALGAANTVLTSNGASSAPSFAAASGGGATNLWIPASAWIPRTTGGCGVDSREIGATNRANVDELLFDTGTEEFAQALVVMPSNYNNSTITARFYWTAASGSGGVAWGISGRAYGDDDALDQATGTRIVVTDTFITANDVHVTGATSAVTVAGTPAANKAVNFQISREVGNASDTLGVDARLLGVEIIFN